MLISKIIFKKLKNNYFNIFLSEKYFKKQRQSHFQTISRDYMICHYSYKVI